MLSWQMQESADLRSVRLEGQIDENAEPQLTALRQALKPGRLDLNCAGISLINSVGVLLWTEFLHALPRPSDIEFHECSAFFIDYANLVPSLVAGGRVVSFMAPLRCPKCHTSTTVPLKTAGLDPESGFGRHCCPQCGGELQPEVAPEDFFGFMASAGEEDN